MMGFMKCLLALLAAGGLVQAAFVPPAEGPVPFRRDKLPMDADTMASLSRQLVVMAGGHEGEDPGDLRLRAQLLALSIALDPGNHRARDLAETLADGGDAPESSEEDLDHALDRVWKLQSWLIEPEAGSDAAALADCLGDVLFVLDPRHPASESRGSGEKGNWRDWVAARDRFEDADEPEEAEEPEIAESGGEDPMDEPEESNVAKLRIQEATLNVPLWIYSHETRRSSLKMTAVKMNVWQGSGEDEAWEDEEDRNRLRLRLPSEELSRRGSFGRTLQQVLEARHGKLPERLHIHVSLPENYVYSNSRNGTTLMVPVALLADAAFSGVAPSAAVFGDLDGEGRLVAPPRAWELIRELDGLPDCRLILPASVRELLPALVTLDRAETFFKHEVVLAEDLDDMIRLASGKPPGALAEANAAFEAVRKARGNRSLGSFLGFDSTRQRLNQVVAAFPAHASARLLALRGTSQWPKRLERSVYAKEIRAALVPMGAALNPPWEGIRAGQLETAAEQCRLQLAAVERYYSAVADRDELHGTAVKTSKLLGGLANDFKRASEFFEPYRHVRGVYSEYCATVRKLTEAAGDGDVYPLPKEPE